MHTCSLLCSLLALLGAIVASMGTTLKILQGSTVANAQQFPFMCSITTLDGQHTCGATLIGHNLALTAAECLEPGVSPYAPLILCGSIDYTNNSSDQYDVFSALQITQHECYIRRDYVYDIAVVQLNHSAIHARPVDSLATAKNFDNLSPGSSMLTALGWGAVDVVTRALSNTLQYTELPLVSTEECYGAYSDRFQDQVQFCAGYFGSNVPDTNTGDSGGPVLDSSNTNRLIGITSYGTQGKPGVYTRVDAFSDWIIRRGYCQCTANGYSGSTYIGSNSSSTRHQVLSSSVVEKERQQYTVDDDDSLCIHPNDDDGAAESTDNQPYCYVLEPERCPTSQPSTVYPGAGWILCNQPQPSLQC